MKCSLQDMEEKGKNISRGGTSLSQGCGGFILCLWYGTPTVLYVSIACGNLVWYIVI